MLVFQVVFEIMLIFVHVYVPKNDLKRTCTRVRYSSTYVPFFFGTYHLVLEYHGMVLIMLCHNVRTIMAALWYTVYHGTRVRTGGTYHNGPFGTN